MPETVLVTGANRGIGLALVQTFLNKGHRVIAACRKPDQAQALSALSHTHETLSVYPLDVTDSNAIAQLAQTLRDTPIDLLINNAGIYNVPDRIGDAQSLDDLEANSWTSVLQTNSIAPVLLTRALLPSLRKGTGKKIAMISSRTGSIAGMGAQTPIAYATSKAALNAATKILAAALQKERFVVVTLNPGWVRTDMGGPQANLSPQESAERLFSILEGLTPQQNGFFISHNGETIAW